MAKLPAYAVDGGEVPAEMLRRVLWATSGGENGIVGVHDLKVSPLPTPGAGVRIARGGALVRSRLSGGHEQETYLLAQDSASNVSIPGAVNAGRVDYIIARIDDWHFTGEDAPDNPRKALYWDFERVSTLDGITYPFVPLAKVTLRQGISTITASMIEDIRQVANPRTNRRLFARNLSASEGTQELYEQTEQYWPEETSQPWEVYIPEWATRANIVASWNGISVVTHSGKHGVVFARIGRPDGWGQGNVETQHQKWDLGNSATGREHWELADDVAIPAALRGTVQPLRLIGLRLENLSGQGPKLDSASSIKYDVEFIEAAGRRSFSGGLDGVHGE